MEVVVLQSDHLDQMTLQPSQQYLRDFINAPGYADCLIRGGYAFCAIENGKPIAAAGVIMTQPHIGLSWSLLTDDLSPRNMVSVHRAVKKFIDVSPISRIETHVRADAPSSARRWVEMLGFEYEGRMRGYSQDGVDCLLYARLK